MQNSKLHTKKKTKEVQEDIKRIEELEGQLARALADYQNLERRVQEERREWIRLANKELLLRILPVLDTLVLADKHTQNEGLVLSIKQFEDVLKSEDVSRIETEGKTFDPKTMECLETIEGEEDRVLGEVRTGYMLGEHVLRPAQVRVGKKII